MVRVLLPARRAGAADAPENRQIHDRCADQLSTHRTHRFNRRGHPVVVATHHAEPDAEQGRLRDGVRRQGLLMRFGRLTRRKVIIQSDRIHYTLCEHDLNRLYLLMTTLS